MNAVNAPAQTEETGISAPSVLLAVDNPAARDTLGKYVRAAGFEVHEAVNGAEAWDALHRTQVHATLLLLTETASEAAEFVRKVRKESNFENHPVWVFTLLPSLKHSRSTEPGTTAFCNLLSTSIFSMLAQLAGQIGTGACTAAEVVERMPSEVASQVISLLETETAALVAEMEKLRSSDDVTRAGICADLARQAGALMTCAAVSGRCRLARHAAALRSLLEEVTMRPATLTSGCMQTLTSAAASIAGFAGGVTELYDHAVTAVVLSDSAERRNATTAALAKAGIQATAFSDRDSATQHLTASTANLILVHLHTPAEEIAEVCREFRKLPLHANTPVIVAGLPSQLKNGENLLAAGANELLFQPSPEMEAAVAGLTLIHRHADLTEGHPPALAERNDAVMNTTVDDLLAGSGLDETELRQRCSELGKQLDVMSQLFLEAEAKAVEQHNEKRQALETCAELQARLEARAKETEMLTGTDNPVTVPDPAVEARNRELEEELKFAQEEITELTAARTALTQQKQAAETELQRVRESAMLAPGDRAAKLDVELQRERGEKRRIEQRLSALNKDLELLHSRTRDYFESERATQERLAEMDGELRQQSDELARAKAELEKATKERSSALDQLRAGEALMKELREAAAVYSSAKDALQRRHEQLEARLHVIEANSNEAQSQLKIERSERIKNDEELGAVRQRLQEQEAALAELRCELELEQAENKRLAGEAAEAKYSAIESTRATTAALDALRDTLRQPLDQLLSASRQVLEAELAPEIKKSVDDMVVSALALQSRINE